MTDWLSLSGAVAAVADYLRAGGPVVVALLVGTFVLWALILERLLYFLVTEPRLARQRRSLWQARAEHASWYARAVRERLISEHHLAGEQYLPVIRVLILVTPLLGLLGTVTGMVQVFEIITQTGSSNARLMAAGISRATIPTMTGLAVSLSGIFVINLLARRGAGRVAALADRLDLRAGPATASEPRS